MEKIILSFNHMQLEVRLVTTVMKLSYGKYGGPTKQGFIDSLRKGVWKEVNILLMRTLPIIPT